MTAIQTETRQITVAPVITLKGKGKAARELAYMQIAPLSFVENISRVESIANLRAALGNAPSEAELKTAQTEWCIGRLASRLPRSEFDKAVDYSDDAARLEFARKLVLNYAAPVKPGTTARKLRAGQLGRRNEAQHKACRAADEAWSQVKAELGHGTAQTQKERNASKATRSTNANPVRGATKAKDAATTVPTHAELVTPAKPATVGEVCGYIESMAATLLAFCNKSGNAKLLPTDYGMAVTAFKGAINKAANERALREAAASK